MLRVFWLFLMHDLCWFLDTIVSEIEMLNTSNHVSLQYDDPVYSPSSNQASSFDDPLPNHPHITQVNPPLGCPYATQSFPQAHALNRLRRVISVEVLFTETDSTTEHAQNSPHDDLQSKRNRSLTRSLSASSIEVSSTQFQHRMIDSNLLSPSPTKPVSSHFVYEELESNFRMSRRGSVTSVCSNASTIRLVNVDHMGSGVIVTGNGHAGSHLGNSVCVCVCLHVRSYIVTYFIVYVCVFVYVHVHVHVWQCRADYICTYVRMCLYLPWSINASWQVHVPSTVHACFYYKLPEFTACTCVVSKYIHGLLHTAILYCTTFMYFEFTSCTV